MAPKQSAIRMVRRVGRKARTSWKWIQAGITSRLAHLDRDLLKKALLGCGLAAAAVTAILVLVKFTPLVVTLLLVLGLGALLRMWERLQTRSL